MIAAKQQREYHHNSTTNELQCLTVDASPVPIKQQPQLTLLNNSSVKLSTSSSPRLSSPSILNATNQCLTTTNTTPGAAKLNLIMKERDQLQIELTNTNRKLARFLDHFKARLIYHINGITRLVDATKSNDKLIVSEGLYGLEKYIKHLIADMNATYKIRENQLVNICRSLNGQLHATREAMRKVMICYTKQVPPGLALKNRTDEERTVLLANYVLNDSLLFKVTRIEI
uniref:Uncharacterized protein n=1 Tax=Schistosoma haematobium TaxID=6185 RepID=A0A094ZZA2_SCHHA